MKETLQFSTIGRAPLSIIRTGLAITTSSAHEATRPGEIPRTVYQTTVLQKIRVVTPTATIDKPSKTAMLPFRGNTLGAFLLTEIMMGALQTVACILLYALAAITTGRRVSDPRYVIVNICFSGLLFGQIIAATAYDRRGQLDDGVGTRLLEETALWYVRLYLIVKPVFAVVSAIIDKVILLTLLRRAGFKCQCTNSSREMRARAFGLHDGRFGRVEFLYGWQDVKQTSFLMIRSFRNKENLDSSSSTREYARGVMSFEVIEDQSVRLDSGTEFGSEEMTKGTPNAGHREEDDSV